MKHQQVSIQVEGVDQCDGHRLIGQVLNEVELHLHDKIVADRIASSVELGRCDAVCRYYRGVDEDLHAIGAVSWIIVHKEFVAGAPGECRREGLVNIRAAVGQGFGARVDRFPKAGQDKSEKVYLAES